MSGLSLEIGAKLEQTQILSQELQQGLHILQSPILELRTILQQQMAQNPAIEDVVWKGEETMSTALPDEHASASVSSKELDFDPSTPQGMETLNADDSERDGYLQGMENYEHTFENGSVDPDAESKRQLFFDRQVKNETLQEHLAAQVPLSDMTKEDQKIARELLIASIDDDGWFRGSLPDIEMVTNKSEEHLVGLLAKISQFDPLGCGGRTLRETLLYQMEKLDDSPWEDEVRKLIDLHLDDLLHRRNDVVIKALKIEPRELPLVLGELAKLARKPGLTFAPPVPPENFVKPEVFLTRTEKGEWKVRVPDWNLPDIRISKQFIRLLENPSSSAETKAYVREKVNAAYALRDALAERQETIRKIAQAIVDVQYGVFENKTLTALKPLTMDAIAEKVGVHNSTVSRTVNKKYMATPLGVIELKKFFVGGLSTRDGEAPVSNVAVIERIRQLVEAEDRRKPLSDQKISDRLAKEGIVVARRTVAKYRDQLKIPGTTERKRV